MLIQLDMAELTLDKAVFGVELTISVNICDQETICTAWDGKVPCINHRVGGLGKSYSYKYVVFRGEFSPAIKIV